MIREDHVRFCEGPRVQLPRPTHPYIPMARGFVYLAAVVDWAAGLFNALCLSVGLRRDFSLFGAKVSKSMGSQTRIRGCSMCISFDLI